MNTRVLKVDPQQPDEGVLDQAASILRRGGLVAFPTETVYGLGADATRDSAVARIFEAKGRPQDNPLIVHVHSYDDVPGLVAELPSRAEVLMFRFWPGPLTLVLRKSRAVADRVSPGLETVGIRMPAHEVALGLIRLAGVPVAAPSANVSGRPSPTRAEHVLSDLDGRIEAIVDGGHCGVGVESTVLDLTVTPPAILRPGGTTREAIEEVLGDVVIDRGVNGDMGMMRISGAGGGLGVNGGLGIGGGSGTKGGSGAHHGAPRSPGMKYRHYAPSCQVYLVEAGPDGVAPVLGRFAREFAMKGWKVGILASSEALASAGTGEHDRGSPGDGAIWIDAGSEADLAGVALHLFDNLRRFDDLGVDVVLAQVFPEAGMGLAVMNRLLRAAGGRVVRGGR